MVRNWETVEKLLAGGLPTEEEYARLIADFADPGLRQEVCRAAFAVRERVFGREVYIRSLVEFSGYCRCNCRYCGLRRGNGAAERFRLSEEEILESCRLGYENDFRTFVLQSGEDAFFTDEMVAGLVAGLRREYPDCAITLSIGERSRKAYAAFREAGADRYLLRHETADPGHYAYLHPAGQTFENRRRCLEDLRELGYQVGSGFMVGSPGQTPRCLARDFLFLRELKPAMIGIGPFIPQKDTPFGGFPRGGVELTVFLLALLRLSFPWALLPATTALGTLNGREKGLLAGANVVMLNTSPLEARKRYNIYDHKRFSGDEAVEGLGELKESLARLGLTTSANRGDAPSPQ